MPSSRGSSQPRDQTEVSHITGRFFTIWATSPLQKNFTDPCLNHGGSFISLAAWGLRGHSQAATFPSVEERGGWILLGVSLSQPHNLLYRFGGWSDFKRSSRLLTDRGLPDLKVLKCVLYFFRRWYKNMYLSLPHFSNIVVFSSLQ